MKKLFSFALLGLLLILEISPLQAVEQRMRLKYLEGKVKIYQRKFDKWMRPAKNMFLYYGDRIRTGVASKAVISFNKGNLLFIEENSELELKTPAGKKNRLTLFFGNVFARFNKVRNGGELEIHTSDLFIESKDAEVHVGINKKGVTKVACTQYKCHIIERNDDHRFVLPKNRLIRYKIGEKMRYARFHSSELVQLWLDSFSSYFTEVSEIILEDTEKLPQQVETNSSQERFHLVSVNLLRAYEQLERYEDEMDRDFNYFYDLFKEDNTVDDRKIRNTVRILTAYKSIQKVFTTSRRFYRKQVVLAGVDANQPEFKKFSERYRQIEVKFHRASHAFKNLSATARNVENQLNTISQEYPVQ